MSPYQVFTGFAPRNPIATLVRSDANWEVISPNEYVKDLGTSLSDIYKNVMKAQEERAKEAESRGKAGRVARWHVSYRKENLSNPKPGHTTGRWGRGGARRGGGAGQGWVGRDAVGSIRQGDKSPF